MKKQNAFTSVELLVVIAIIALLMGILIPTLSKAREQGKKVVCTGHMNGLGVALRKCVDDYDGKRHDSPNQGLWDNPRAGGVITGKYGPNDDSAYWG